MSSLEPSPAASRPQPQDLERRVGSRVAQELPVELYLTGHPHSFPALTRNLGARGICVRTPFPFALGDLREIVLALPGAPMQLAADARWQREDITDEAFLTGIAFRAPRDEQSRALWRAVQRRVIELSRFVHERCHIDGLALADARDIALATSLRQVPRGNWIYRQGSDESGRDSIFLVQSGEVVLEARVTREHEVWIERIETGGLFGGYPIVAGRPNVYSAVAETEVSLLEIDRFTFRHLERAKPFVARILGEAARRQLARHMLGLAARAAARSR